MSVSISIMKAEMLSCPRTFKPGLTGTEKLLRVCTYFSKALLGCTCWTSRSSQRFITHRVNHVSPFWPPHIRLPLIGELAVLSFSVKPLAHFISLPWRRSLITGLRSWGTQYSAPDYMDLKVMTKKWWRNHRCSLSYIQMNVEFGGCVSWKTCSLSIFFFFNHHWKSQVCIGSNNHHHLVAR